MILNFYCNKWTNGTFGYKIRKNSRKGTFYEKESIGSIYYYGGNSCRMW